VSLSRRAEVLTLLAILAVAAGLRLWGIGWGLPYPYHPDEGSILFHSLGFGTGDLNPHWFRWPSLLMYVMFGVYAGYYLVLKAVGTFSVPLDLVRAYLTDPTPFWVAGRLVSAAAGVATVWVTYTFAKRAFGRAAGLGAAAFLAVVFLHVRDSHYATPDVAATFLASVSLFFAISAAQSGRARDLALSALAAGLSASAKYPGVLAGVGTLAAFFILDRARKVSSWVLPACAVVLLLGFVIGTPYALASRAEFVRDVLRQFTMVSEVGVAQHASSFADGLREVFVKTLGRGVGLPILALAVAGVVACAGSCRRGAVILVSYVAAVLVFALLITVKRSTYLTPALPAIAALAGAGVDALFFRPSARRVRLRAAGCAVVLAVVAIAAVPSARYDAALASVDTRTAAKLWLEEHVPAGSRIAVEEFGPVLNPTTNELALLSEETSTAVESWQGPKARLAELRREVGSARAPQFEVYDIGAAEGPFGLPDSMKEPGLLVQRIEGAGIAYVVLSSKAQPERPMDGAENPRGATQSPFQTWLSGRARLVARFVEERPMPVIDRGQGRAFHNPVIEIYELPTGGRGGPAASEDAGRYAEGC
jgi:hypothetical protein